MRKLISMLAALALPLSAGVAHADALEKGEAIQVGDSYLMATGDPRLCIDRDDSNFRALDNQTLLFLAEGRLFINRLSKECPMLFAENALTSIERRTNRICRNDTMRILKDAGLILDSCSLGAFTPVGVAERNQ